MSTRKIIDAKHNGEKVWLKGHAKATYMSNGTTVEDAINNIETGGGGENNCKSPFITGTGDNSAVIDSDTFCEATGVSSFAMGIHAKAIGEASVAMGRYAKAEGRASFALGGAMNSIYVTGEANATEYIATNIYGPQKEDATLLIGYDILEYRTDSKNAYLATIINAEPTDTYGTVRITVDKSLSEEAITNMRFYLHYCRAVERNSTVLGAGGAHGIFSAALGFSVAAGNYAASMGFGTIAKGKQSFSSGNRTKAEGTDSHTEGYRTISKGRASHAEGYMTHAIGVGAHAEGGGGYNIYFTGDGSNSTYQIQYGSNWQCVEDLSKLIGGEIIDYSNNNTIATIQSYSLADDGYTLAVTLNKSLGVLDGAKFGIILNIASGDFSHTQNGGTRASGENATSMGSHTVASGESSLATGDRTFATGENSSTHGQNTHALNKNEAAFGVSNISHNGEGLDAQTLFSIGCGDDISGIDMVSRIEQRIPFPKMEDGRNAVEVMRNGDIWLGGYNTGVKIWDSLSRKSPYLTDPNGTNKQVVLGDGSLKSISELSPITDADADILLDNHIHSINVNANGNNVNINVIESSKSGNNWETEDNDITIPLATPTSAGVMSKEDKAKLDDLSVIEIKYTPTEYEYGNHEIVNLYNIVYAISNRLYNNGWLYNDDKSYDVVVKGWVDNKYNAITYANFNVRLLTTRDGHSLGINGYVDVAQITETNENADCPLWVGYICGKYHIEDDGMAFYAPENPNFIVEA